MLNANDREFLLRVALLDNTAATMGLTFAQTAARSARAALLGEVDEIAGSAAKSRNAASPRQIAQPGRVVKSARKRAAK